MKIGIFSGTFDPVHVGHVTFALAAAQQFGLDEVLLVPDFLPRQKQNTATFKHRINMLNLAVKSHPAFSVLAIKQDKPFTIKHTMPKIHSARPGAQFVFLCGSDVARNFTNRWEGLDDFLLTTQVVIGLRGTDTKHDMLNVFAQLAPHANYHIIASPKHQMASTKARQGANFIDDIDPLVSAYITKNRLYSDVLSM